MAYTYRIQWSKTRVSYYGVRFAKGCSVTDLWKSYFTSSKYVKQYVLEHGDPDLIEIRKDFGDDITSAREWESKVLRRIKAKSRSDYLNKTDNVSISPECCSYEHSQETRMKKSKSHIGKRHSEETRQKMRESSKRIDRHWLSRKRPKQSEKMSGKNNSTAKTVEYCGEVFFTIKDLCDHLGVSRWEVSKMISSNKIKILER